MADEWVVDASVLGAAFFEEKGSQRARQFLLEHQCLVAPDLLALEIASLSAKKVWRGLATSDVGTEALKQLPGLLQLLRPGQAEIQQAYDLAAKHHISAYDAIYMTLALARQAKLVTLDDKLVEKAREAGLGDWVRPIST